MGRSLDALMVLMVVDDPDVVLGVFFPPEDHPPLLVDPNAPESVQFPLQLFKSIARGNQKVLNDPGLIDHPELASGPLLDVPRQAFDPQATVNALSGRIAEAFNHLRTVRQAQITSNVIRESATF